MGFKQSRKNMHQFIKSLYPFLYVVTDDERPVIDTCLMISSLGNIKYNVLTWNSGGGLFSESTGTQYKLDSMNPAVAFQTFLSLKEDSILILSDFHLDVQRNSLNTGLLKNTVNEISVPFLHEYALKRGEAQNVYKKHIIMSSPIREIPKELERNTALVEFDLPDEIDISELIEKVLASNKSRKKYTQNEINAIINASLGLTETELFNVYSKSMYSTEDNKIVASFVLDEKIQIIKKDGSLEYTPAQEGFGEVGGMKNVINWMNKRKIAFDEVVRSTHNLSYPKGILLTGIQGCGKSYITKAIANDLKRPLLKLDLGSLMDKWVGASEHNLRRALRIAESISPVVLWIDELDKVIPDPRSANTHEVTKRLFSTLLTWMQEKTTPVFIVATANNIDHLPPELMRKGRFDEIFVRTYGLLNIA